MTETASSLKDEGNVLFKQGNYLKAAAVYTKAIKLDPENAVLYSNRSAALLKINKVAKALADADKAISLDPKWEKGWIRRAAVFEAQQQLEEALEAYRQAAAVAPDNRHCSARVRDLSKAVTARSKAAAKAASRAAAPDPSAQQSGAAPALPAPVAAFALEILTAARDRIYEEGPGFGPMVHFKLPGAAGADAPSTAAGSRRDSSISSREEAAVQGEVAFTSPEVLTEFVAFLRRHAESVGAQASAAVVPKAAVSFPQTWQRGDWPFGSANGVFVQVQARGGSRQLWFIRVDSTDGKSHIPMAPKAISWDFALLPSLFRD